MPICSECGQAHGLRHGRVQPGVGASAVRASSSPVDGNMTLLADDEMCPCGKGCRPVIIDFAVSLTKVSDDGHPQTLSGDQVTGWSCLSQRRGRAVWEYYHMDPKSRRARAIVRLAKRQNWANIQ